MARQLKDLGVYDTRSLGSEKRQFKILPLVISGVLHFFALVAMMQLDKLDVFYVQWVPPLLAFGAQISLVLLLAFFLLPVMGGYAIKRDFLPKAGKFVTGTSLMVGSAWYIFLLAYHMSFNSPDLELIFCVFAGFLVLLYFFRYILGVNRYRKPGLNKSRLPPTTFQP